VCNYLGVEYR